MFQEQIFQTVGISVVGRKQKTTQAAFSLG